MEQAEPQVPHVVFLLIPALGHIKPMLKLAEFLSRASFQVTFINTQRIHDRLLSTDLLARYPEFQFLTIPDVVPRDRPRSGTMCPGDFLLATGPVIKPALRQLLISLCKKKGRWQPATCIIEDGLLSSSVIDVAEEFQVPVFAFRTLSACCIWTYFHVPKLVEEGDFPVVQDKDMDKPVTCIPGLENVVRRRDLPGIFRIERADDPGLEFFINDQTLVMPRAFALILNTFDGLEATMISKLASVFTKMYTVGPLHGLSNARAKDLTTSASSNSILWKEDRGCMPWLDSQPSRSVVFVSFGSLIGLTRDKMLEFGHGLVNSGYPFLWVIRPDLITGEADPSLIVGELTDMIEDNKGLMVSWAPQEEVLAHPAIGVFLTHSGWNSTLESVYAGVPMICWPAIGDQQINSRFVSDVWKIGLDMKDTCDRSTIEKMVRSLMEDKREEIMKSVNKIKKLAHETVKDGGSSFSNLEKLIDDIWSLSHFARKERSD
ncbi:PREDICTED: 7-deoxyloganetic acid glucosyltransferase [Theobroma cacao]|uniref:Glycosyltransferase n=1 Tax=Theobroma cacao TaxID=3641 RepID=A0AB32V1Z3_THECC|nr:PREDICTED: 7-deoxyloganetic acid glucosyltransferase [Theobroma cacao]